MRVRKFIYCILVITLTATSVSAMVNLKNLYPKVGLSNASDYMNTDFMESEYLGYIFDDYNEKVNLGYVDKTHNNDDSIKEISSSSPGSDLSEEGIGPLRSADEISGEYESAKASTINLSEIADFYDSMEPDDSAEFERIIIKCGEDNIGELKELFDVEVAVDKEEAILNHLQNKLSLEECDWLSKVAGRYR